ncbi:MAG: hypothetical protein H6709_03960 [Kofleriaceae bacterium]|nr:hypothetical protein [Myxococcales bacterium]MCB9560212.1 hypothetical protein [Kofleriaceae bacterium]MCB9571225.1 hypothetical protein [Kofleriaceae bacterium]
MTGTTSRLDGASELSIEIIDDDGRVLDTVYVTEITGRSTTPSREHRIARPPRQARDS